MAGYAAAMDASMMGGSSSQDVTTLLETGAAGPPELSAAREGAGGADVAAEDWESQTEDANLTSLSVCVSEGSCRKNRGERSPSALTEPRFTSSTMEPISAAMFVIGFVFSLSSFLIVPPFLPDLSSLLLRREQC